MEKISVVITVFNEAPPNLLRQTRKPDEIIIIDAKDYNNCNRSRGRNIGVSKSKGNIIAFTDAGCIPEKTWLEELIKPFKDPQVKVVSGYYKGLPKNIFEKCLVPYVLVMPDKIQGEFFPSTRSMALRRSIWNKAGGFDEKLWHNEDYAFAHKLKTLGVNFYFASKAIVGWMPRKDLRSAIWMFTRFAIGDAQAGILRPKVKLLALRYYLFFFFLFLNKLSVLLAIPYIIWSILKNYKYVNDIKAIFWLPVLQITSDISILFGTIVGLLSKTTYASKT